MRKVIVFCAYFYPHEGGVESYVNELFRNLPGCEITIVTANTEHAKSFEVYKGFRICRLPCWHLLGKTYPVIKPEGWKILKALGNYDYVFTNTRFFNTTFLGYRFAKSKNIPLVHIEHGTNHSRLANPFSKAIAVLYDHTIGRLIIKKCYKLVAISDSAAKFSKHLYDRGSIIIRNSVDAKSFKKMSIAQAKKLKKKLGIGKEKVIVYVGRLIYAKGLQDLFAATEDLDVKLLIIGDGNYREKLMALDKKHIAIFLGQRNKQEIINHLSIADIFVNPSYAEGLPTSVLEAGALGIPVIATDVGGTSEIIQDKRNGFLIEAHDIDALKSRIIQLLGDDELRRRFSSELMKKIRNEFDWHIARTELLKLLNH